MDQALKWSYEAKDDLRQIHEYIERDSPTYADDFVLRLISVAESIVEFPRRGRVVPEVGNPDVRELIVGNYRLVYRILNQRVEIAGVIHGARQLPERGSWSEPAA